MSTAGSHAAAPGGDTTFVATRVTSSRLVGRGAELAELDAAVADAAEGRPSLAFIAGESGVGKSRLFSALAQQARERGARVECGDCVELGDDELPYAPIVAVLRGLARDEDPILDTLSPSARGQLGTLLPELRDGASPPGRAPSSPRRRCSRRCSRCSIASGRSSRWSWGSRTSTGPTARPARS